MNRSVIPQRAEILAALIAVTLVGGIGALLLREPGRVFAREQGSLRAPIEDTSLHSSIGVAAAPPPVAIAPGETDPAPGDDRPTPRPEAPVPPPDDDDPLTDPPDEPPPPDDLLSELLSELPPPLTLPTPARPASV